MNRKTRDLFSAISPTYDAVNHILSFSVDKSWRKKTVRHIAFDRSASLTALDLCAGTFDLAIKFLAEFKHSSVWAVDFSEAMLKAGQKKITPDMAERINVVCADALSLPFPDCRFDVVFCGYGFRNLDDKKGGLEEIWRVLKPGGQLLILDFFRPVKMPAKIFHHTYGNLVLPLVGRLVSRQKGAYRYLHNSIADFYTTDECKNLLEKQMFSKVYSRNFFMGISSLVTGFKKQHENRHRN